MQHQIGTNELLIMVDDLEARIRELENYVFSSEPNILPDIKPEGRGLEESTVGRSGTDETI